MSGDLHLQAKSFLASDAHGPELLEPLSATAAAIFESVQSGVTARAEEVRRVAPQPATLSVGTEDAVESGDPRTGTGPRAADEFIGEREGARSRPRHGMRQTSQGSFSAVSKRNFASEYAFESSRRDLHNALLCTALQSIFFFKNYLLFARFCEILV